MNFLNNTEIEELRSPRTILNKEQILTSPKPSEKNSLPGFSVKALVRSWPFKLLESLVPGSLHLPFAIRGLIPFFRDWFWFKKVNGADFPIHLVDIYPCLADRYVDSGVARGHYFHQDIWAARKIFRKRPDYHLDIGSRVDGFVAHLLVFMEVEVLDIRALEHKVEHLTFKKGDACDLPEIATESIGSLSSLHALEHIGLGRYGDPINPGSYLKAASEMHRILAPGGNFYFSVPIGRQRICFNAHRVFNPFNVLKMFNGLRLVEFSAVNDQGDLVGLAEMETFTESEYSLGLYHFTK